MNLLGRRRFGALVAPGGIHLVEYRWKRHGLETLGTWSDAQPVADAVSGFERLGRLLGARGARGAAVAAVLHGFGARHHLASLPPAEPEVLRPVLMRELARFYPELGDAVVEYVALGRVEVEGRTREEVLAGAAPRAVVLECRDVLAARGYELEHLTVVPQALRRLHEAFVGSHEPTALLLLLGDEPLLGFFHEGRLRLFSEPPKAVGGKLGGVEALVELVERGTLFLRLEFGATLERVLVRAEPAERARIEAQLRSELQLEAAPWGPEGGVPGALAALGAALDAADARGLNLIPPEHRPPAPTVRMARRLAVAGATVLVAGGLAWGWAGVGAAADAREALARVEHELEARAAPLAVVRAGVDARRAHGERLAFLATTAAERQRVQRVLAEVAAAAPAAIRLDSLVLGRAGDVWQAEVAGVATGASSAQAVRAIDALYRGLGRRIAADSVVLTRLDYPPADGDPAARGGGVEVVFGLAFTVTPVEGGE